MRSTHKKWVTISFIFIAFLRFGYSQVPSPGFYTLFITLENAPFENLSLFEYTGDRRILIEGKQAKKYIWEFTIPDSIIWDSENMALKVSKYDPVTNSTTSVRFTSEKDNKKIRTGNIGVEDRLNYIFAKYKEKSIARDQYIVLKTKDNRDSLITGDLIIFDFDLLPQNGDNSDIMLRAEASSFSRFSDKNKSYEEHLESYVKIAKQYPDSRYLITNLATMLTQYKSKEDVQLIYDNFSDKHKDSFWAKKIDRFLYRKFENQQLPSLHTNTYEHIVHDTSKFNLVVFTASWCVPCIKEIPLLKEVYKDLGEKLELTYISIDKKEDIPAFQEVVKKHEIPWRTLLSHENIKKIRERYFVESIPHGILVSPDHEMELIEIRDTDQRKKLYNRVLNNNDAHLNKIINGYKEN